MNSANPFPRLTATNHRVTSPPDAAYNRVAWAAGDVAHWWQPGVYWPVESPPADYGIGVLVQAFEALGYETCADGRPEPGYLKVALYGDSRFYTHAARQFPDGRWTSKLGREEDLEHETPEDVAGGIYGDVVRFMKRPLPQAGTVPPSGG